MTEGWQGGQGGGDRLDAIRQRRAAITPGPWSASDVTGNVYGDERPARDAPGTEDTWVADVGGDENREFIAHAPEDIDTLLRCVDRLEAMVRERVHQVEQLKELLQSIEWAGVHRWSYEESGCPVCHAEENTHHDPQCWLFLAIRRA